MLRAGEIDKWLEVEAEAFTMQPEFLEMYNQKKLDEVHAGARDENPGSGGQLASLNMVSPTGAPWRSGTRSNTSSAAPRTRRRRRLT